MSYNHNYGKPKLTRPQFTRIRGFRILKLSKTVSIWFFHQRPWRHDAMCIDPKFIKNKFNWFEKLKHLKEFKLAIFRTKVSLYTNLNALVYILNLEPNPVIERFLNKHFNNASQSRPLRYKEAYWLNFETKCVENKRYIGWVFDIRNLNVIITDLGKAIKPQQNSSRASDPEYRPVYRPDYPLSRQALKCLFNAVNYLKMLDRIYFLPEKEFVINPKKGPETRYMTTLFGSSDQNVAPEENTVKNRMAWDYVKNENEIYGFPEWEKYKFATIDLNQLTPLDPWENPAQLEMEPTAAPFPMSSLEQDWARHNIGLNKENENKAIYSQTKFLKENKDFLIRLTEIIIKFEENEIREFKENELPKKYNKTTKGESLLKQANLSSVAFLGALSKETEAPAPAPGAAYEAAATEAPASAPGAAYEAAAPSDNKIASSVADVWQALLNNNKSLKGSNPVYRFAWRLSKNDQNNGIFKTPEQIANKLNQLDPAPTLSVYQLESDKNTNTLYFQGYLKFKTKTRPQTLENKLKVFIPGVVVLPVTDESTLIAYCQKKETRVRGPWANPPL